MTPENDTITILVIILQPFYLNYCSFQTMEFEDAIESHEIVGDEQEPVSTTQPHLPTRRAMRGATANPPTGRPIDGATANPVGFSNAREAVAMDSNDWHSAVEPVS